MGFVSIYYDSVREPLWLTCVLVTPVLDTEENAGLLSRWEGSWSYLTNVKWVRVSSAGQVQPSSFPPRGEH